MVVHAKPMGRGLHLLRRLRPGAPPGRPRRRSRSWSATTRCSRPRRSTPRSSAALRRRLVVVGACIGTDAHTVGIDAILNIKGFAGEKGLEYYRELKVVNLGAQVTRARAGRAGPRARRPTPSWSPRWSPSATPTCSTPARWPRRSARPTRPDTRPLLVVGGPRFDETMAAELGVDRVFGRGTTPGEVACYLVHRARPTEKAGRMTDQDPRRRTDRHPPPLRALLPRPLRRQPGRRRLQPRPVRRRRHRGVHPSPTATRALFASYSDVQFLAPVRAGDVLEATAERDRVGRRSRELTFEARVVCRADPERGAVGRRGARPSRWS